MCLTSQAFGIMLSLVPLGAITVGDGNVSVRTPDRTIVWLAVGPEWCTGKPGTEADA